MPSPRLKLEPLEGRITPADLVVTILDDGAPNDDDELTLREAILIANDDSGMTTFAGQSSTDEEDRITFMSGLSGTLTLNQGVLSVLQAVEIDGGQAPITIDGDDDSRVFDLGDGDGTATVNGVTLVNLTVTGGKTDVTTEDGGGIRSRIEGDLTITGVTLTGNESADDGGGLAVVGSLIMTNSTVSGNVARQNGGGLDIDGSADLSFSTVVNNEAGGNGGGLIIRDGLLPTLNADGVIVALNEDTGNGGNPDLDLPLLNDLLGTGFTNSLIGDAKGTGLSESQGQDSDGNFIGRTGGGADGAIDPLIGNLADNGGPTPTHALLGGSLALNTAGEDGPAGDQRGVTRGGLLSMGAYEADAVAFEVTGFPSPAESGTEGDVTVAALDAFGKAAVGYVGTVELTSSDPAAALPGDFTFTTGDAGTADLPVTLVTAGTQSITATDADDDTVTGTQSGIVVNNDPPTLDGAEAEIDENPDPDDQVVTLAAEDPQPGDELTYAITGGNTDGAFAITEGPLGVGEDATITVADPSAVDFERNPSFTLEVTVTDANGEAATADVTVTVNDRPEAPTVSDDTFSVAEEPADDTFVGQVEADDPDGDLVSFAITSGNVGTAFAIDDDGNITVNRGSQIDDGGPQQFTLTVRATDSGGMTGSGTITINVESENDAPQVADQSFEVAENSDAGTVVDTVIAQDDDDDLSDLTFEVDGTAFDINGDGELTVADPDQLDFEGTNPVTVTVTVSDDDGASDTATITVTLTDVNEAPEVEGQSFSIDENSSNGTLIGRVVADDVDGDDLTFGITGAAFAIDDDGNLTVADSSQLNFEDDTEVTETVTVTDPDGLEDTATVTVNLDDVNDAPEVENQSFSIDENSSNGTLIGRVVADDEDGDDLTFGITGTAFAIDDDGDLAVADSSQLNFEDDEQITVTVTVTDTGGLSDTATVTVNLNDINDRPVIEGATFSVVENSEVGTELGVVRADDDDLPDDTLTFTIEAGDPNGVFRIDESTGLLSVNDPAGLDFEVGPQQFSLTVRVADADGLAADATVAVNVTDANDPPALGDVTITVAENTPEGTPVADLDATDQDGDNLTYALTGTAFDIDPDTGEVTVADPSQLNFETSPDGFQLLATVTDDGDPVRSTTATVRVVIDDANEAPVVTNDTIVVGDDELIPFLITEGSKVGNSLGVIEAIDPEGDGVTFSGAGRAFDGPNPIFAIDEATGEITLVDPTQIGFDDPGLLGTVFGTVTATDDSPEALSTSVDVRVIVQDANDPPAFDEVAAPFAIDENSPEGTFVGTVTVTDVDEDDALTFTIDDPSFRLDPTTAAPQGGSVGVNVFVGPNAVLDFERLAEIQLAVTATDDGFPILSDTVNVTVALTDINEAPAFSPDGVALDFAVAENSRAGAFVGRVTAADVDAGDSLTFAGTGEAFDGPDPIFRLDPQTGNITLLDPSQIGADDPGLLSRVTGSVTVTDADGLADTADIAVEVQDVNEAPVVTPPEPFAVDENSPAGTAVGRVEVFDIDRDELTFAINDPSFLAVPVESDDGRVLVDIVVAEGAFLNFEAAPTILLTLTAVDDGLPPLAGTAQVTVNLNNVNEAPAFEFDPDEPLPVSENSPEGTIVGTAPARDEDDGDSLTFAITGGNEDGFFRVGAGGVIRVNQSDALDLETKAEYTLSLRVTDAAGADDTTAVTIALDDDNDAPVLEPARGLSVRENPELNQVIAGAVTATDQDAGDLLTYRIVGVTGVVEAADGPVETPIGPGAFAIADGDAATASGVARSLVVLRPEVVNFEAADQIIIEVIARDSGGADSQVADVVLSLEDVFEAIAPTAFIAAGLPDSQAVVLTASNGQIVSAAPVLAFDTPQANVRPELAAADSLNPVRPAVGDVIGSGTLDFVFGSSPLTAIDDDTAARLGLQGTDDARVSILDGETGQRFTLRAFEEGFKDGVFVDLADFDGDGREDIVIAPEVGGSGRVRVLSVSVGDDGNLAVTTLADFFGIDDPNWRGGARVSVGDINGDGTPDLAVAAAEGGGPRVAIWDGAAILADGVADPGDKIVGDFFAFAPSATGGAHPAVGDVDGDGFADLTVGAGRGSLPLVKIYSGLAVSMPTFSSASPDDAAFTSFLVGITEEELGADPVKVAALTGGVRVAAVNLGDDDLGGDQFRADIVAHNVPLTNQTSVDTEDSPPRGELKIYPGSNLLTGLVAEPATVRPFSLVQFFDEPAEGFLFDGLYFG